MKVISGGQSGVDRAALDAALACGIDYGGWCPRGGWAEDFPSPPGVLSKYPLLKETPLPDPAQRTEWNVRDANAILIVVGEGGTAVSEGTALAVELAQRDRHPTLTIDPSDPEAGARTLAWIAAQRVAFGEAFVLSVGGPRESEAPGIYARALAFLRGVLPVAKSA
jgi:predicted Rossmann-fold nucleotide-binding protein